jgi:hypothetical protein
MTSNHHNFNKVCIKENINLRGMGYTNKNPSLFKKNQHISSVKSDNLDNNIPLENFYSFNSSETVSDNTMINPKKIFKCDILGCTKEYTQKYRLNIHKRIHVRFICKLLNF